MTAAERARALAELELRRSLRGLERDLDGSAVTAAGVTHAGGFSL
jgi:hypothetical protein